MKPVISSSSSASAPSAVVIHLQSLGTAKQKAPAQHQELKQLWQQSKLPMNRRHSFDDNGGGYKGL